MTDNDLVKALQGLMAAAHQGGANVEARLTYQAELDGGRPYLTLHVEWDDDRGKRMETGVMLDRSATMVVRQAQRTIEGHGQSRTATREVAT